MDNLLRGAAMIERAVAIALDACNEDVDCAIMLLMMETPPAPYNTPATREQWGRLVGRVMGRWAREGGRPDVR